MARPCVHLTRPVIASPLRVTMSMRHKAITERRHIAPKVTAMAPPSCSQTIVSDALLKGGSRQSRLAGLWPQVFTDAFHRLDRLQGVLLFDSCATLMDGDMARRVKGVTGCQDIMRGASEPALHI